MQEIKNKPTMKFENDRKMAVDVSVVIPVFNEIEGIERCFSEVQQILKKSEFSYEIIFVDDGSIDGSFEKLLHFSEINTNVLVVKLKRNFGQQQALREGMRHSRGDVNVLYDSDLQYPPDCILQLVYKIREGYEIVSGVRKVRKDNFITNRVPSWVGGWLINKALSVKISDFGAVKAFNRKLVDDILEMEDDNVIIYAAAYSLSDNYTEMQIQHRKRLYGSSKWAFFMRLDLYLTIYTTYAKRPFELMLVGGGTSFLLGLLLAVCILFFKIFISSEFSGTIIFFDVFLIITGIHFITLSIIGEFAVRIFRKTRYNEKKVVSISTSH